jgi:octaprenyl-diphosphate synthase
MMLLAQSNGRLSERLAADLADVQTRFTDELASDLTCVNELVDHVERYRGKMLRPTLTLVAAMAVEPDGRTREAHRVLATVVELIHMATLVHDDILDEAAMRRQGATVNHLSGNETAVMLGDYLISHAYHLCSSLDRPVISRQIAAATNTVCEGELLQLANRRNWDLDEQTYLQIIERKTASLCGVCCEGAALLSETPGHVAEALGRYGAKLGAAFQIIDDLLDLAGEESLVGKTLGRDLDKSKLTLPCIVYLRGCTGAERAQMVGLLQAQAKNGHDLEHRQAVRDQVHGLLATSDAMAYARREADRLVDEARAAVTEHLPDTPARQTMLGMAQAVVSRRF